jgi:glycosyltransferase involved in cell wall biosynthesis
MSLPQSLPDRNVAPGANRHHFLPMDASNTLSNIAEATTASHGHGSDSSRLRVLVDLKPALDGYAGIPQESRLLYHGFCGLPGIQAEGLIQHGGRRLRPALSLRGKELPQDKRINRLSRFVISLYQDPHNNFFEMLQVHLDRMYSRQWMRMRSRLGISLRMTQFESTLFEDFVWRTFFSKTLNARDKPLFRNAPFRVLTDPRHAMHVCGLASLKYQREALYPVVDTRDFDFFLTQTPFPGRVRPSTTMVVRYHDAVPILMPHTIHDKGFHQASHFHALKDNVKQGAWFSCISEATRADLLKIFPQAEKRSFVIHNMVSDEYSPEPSSPEMVDQIVSNRLAPFEEAKLKPMRIAQKGSGKPHEYLLMVSTIEPRKNHLLLMEAWERLRYTVRPNLKLILVGNTGWDQGPVLRAMKPWAERGELYWLNNVPSSELRVLYQHAAVTVCPGLAEGFDYSGVEAMKCGGLVAASDIPVHREIYQDAAAYFDTYDAEHAAAVVNGLLESRSAGPGEAMRTAGFRVSGLYSERAIMPHWEAFFAEQARARREALSRA